MPILSELSRRLHLLTTDAIPDPPRIKIEGYTHNLDPDDSETRRSKAKPVSEPGTPEATVLEHRGVTERQKSLPNGAVPTTGCDQPTGETFTESRRDSAGTEAREQKRPGVKTKSRSRQYKYGASVVNYNIVNSNGVNIGSRTSYICNVNQQSNSTSTTAEGGGGGSSSQKPKARQMSTEVERLCGSSEEITLDEIYLIKTHLGHGWRELARGLNYSDGQIDQFEENYKHRGVDEVIYQLLLDWKQANTRHAEIGRIVSALWACQEYDCVDRLLATRSRPS